MFTLTNEQLQELAKELGVEVQDENSKFDIDSLDKLIWAMRKIEGYKNKLQSIKEAAKIDIDRTTAWANKQSKEVEENIKFFELKIADYAAAQRAANPKFKKESTPYGDIAFKKQQTKWDFVNEEEAVNALKLMGKSELLKVIPETSVIANKTDVKKHFAVAKHAIVEMIKEGEEAGKVKLIETINFDENDSFTVDEEGRVYDILVDKVTEYEYLSDVAYDTITLEVLQGVQVYDQPDKLVIGG